MNILFIHGNYPAQFRQIAGDLGKQTAHDVRFLTARKDPEQFPIPGVNVVTYDDIEKSRASTEGQSQTIINEIVSRGEQIQSEVIRLIRGGFYPRLVVFHGGNGLGLYLRQVLPGACLVGYFEWHFSKRCAEIILGRNDLGTLNYIQNRNLFIENEILNCDAGVVPTEWQAAQFPSKLRPYLSVIFDGIDTSFFSPGDRSLLNKTVILKGEDDEIVIRPDEVLLTYATRGMEPLRGFPEFMRSLPPLLERFANLKVLIGGRDRSAYGPACQSHNGSWKEKALEELPSLRNHPRITYTGLMSYENYLNMLRRTNLHCYLTKPYVTSWSLFEAAACGTPIITNRSPATSGTLSISDERILDNIDDISKSEGIQKISLLLEQQELRKSFLSDEFSLGVAKQKWESLLNSALKQTVTNQA